ncbi:unnamed protein product, partial [Staurois parvus]
PTSEHRSLHCSLVPPPTHLQAPSLDSTPHPPPSTVPWFHPPLSTVLGSTPYPPLSTIPWFQPLLTSKHHPLVPNPYSPPSTVRWFHPLPTSEHSPLAPPTTHL